MSGSIIPPSGLVGISGLLCVLAAAFALRNGWPPTLAADGGYLIGGETDTETEKPAGLFRWLTTVDHKDIGILYIVFATATALWGGTDALMIRTQLLTPGAVHGMRRHTTLCLRRTG